MNFYEIEGISDTIFGLKIILSMFACKSKLIWSTPILLAGDYFWPSTDVHTPWNSLENELTWRNSLRAKPIVRLFQLIHFKKQSNESINLSFIL